MSAKRVGPKPLTTRQSVIVLAALALVFAIAVWLTPAGGPTVDPDCAAWHARWDGATSASDFINASNTLPEGCNP
jgi:hypothetical protein